MLAKLPTSCPRGPATGARLHQSGEFSSAQLRGGPSTCQGPSCPPLQGTGSREVALVPQRPQSPRPGLGARLLFFRPAPIGNAALGLLTLPMADKEGKVMRRPAPSRVGAGHTGAANARAGYSGHLIGAWRAGRAENVRLPALARRHGGKPPEGRGTGTTVAGEGPGGPPSPTPSLPWQRLPPAG